MPVSQTDLLRAALDSLEEAGRALQRVNQVTLDAAPLTALTSALGTLQTLTTNLATALKSQGDHVNQTDPNVTLAQVSILRGVQILNAIDPASLSAATRTALATFQTTAVNLNGTLGTAVMR